MRLNEKTKNGIIESVLEHFSRPEKIILFGSRIDDFKKGGDIDLLVETPVTGKAAFEEKLKAVSAMQIILGEQRIDLITTAGTDDERLIVRNAYREGIPLWTKQQS